MEVHYFPHSERTQHVEGVERVGGEESMKFKLPKAEEDQLWKVNFLFGLVHLFGYILSTKENPFDFIFLYKIKIIILCVSIGHRLIFQFLI